MSGVRIPPDAFLCKYTSDSSQHLETEDRELGNFREWLSDNLRYILLGLAYSSLFSGIAIFVVRLIGGNTGGSQKEPINLTETKGTESATEGSSQAAQSETTAESTAQTEALVENDADILTFVTNYYTAIADKDLDSFADTWWMKSVTRQRRRFRMVLPLRATTTSKCIPRAALQTSLMSYLYIMMRN